ncbi:CLUMA_CG010064, isoform B [Clunio marinus]|uniref:CLUMA_CG010064, isoform B n=1 Tax=Clunio marinus TaxID=568069 RepID=A0A1J1I9P4_9DIPT|nr:CLUMA_CG010064, isoform B [Clunio marinus]
MRSTETFKCFICKILFCSVEELECHFKSHEINEVDRFPCHLCDLKFIKFSTLESHHLIVHLKRNINESTVSDELRILRKEANECLKKLKGLEDNYEESCHSDFRNVDDEVSDNEISSNVIRNKENENTKGEKVFICKVSGCSRTFRHMTSLIMHGKCIHSDERNFTCEICSKTFKTKSNLNVHIKMHKNQRDHHCTECSQSFFTSSHLKAHLRIHRNETRYKCLFDGCGKSFIHLSSFKKHNNFHSGVKDYHCNICQRKFSQFCHLREHLKIHLNEREHICSKCNKAFRRADTLRIHLQIVLVTHIHMTNMNKEEPNLLLSVCAFFVVSKLQIISYNSAQLVAYNNKQQRKNKRKKNHKPVAMESIIKKFISPSLNNQNKSQSMTGPQNSDNNFLRERSGSVASQSPSSPTTPTERKPSVDQDSYFYFIISKFGLVAFINADIPSHVAG